MIALFHQTKTSISFWCRQGLNSRSLIQPSETFSVELTGRCLLWYVLLKVVVDLRLMSCLVQPARLVICSKCCPKAKIGVVTCEIIVVNFVQKGGFQLAQLIKSLIVE